MSAHEDMDRYFRNRLLNLIHDTMQFCDIAELDRKEAVNAVLSGLFLELVRASVACQMDQTEYLKTCAMAWRAFVRQARNSLRESGGGP